MIYVVSPTFQNFRFWVQRSLEDGTISDPKEAMYLSDPTLLRGRSLTEKDRFEWLPGWDALPQAEQIEMEARMLTVKYERHQKLVGAMDRADASIRLYNRRAFDRLRKRILEVGVFEA